MLAVGVLPDKQGDQVRASDGALRPRLVCEHQPVLGGVLGVTRLNRGPELQLAQPRDRVPRRHPGEIPQQHFSPPRR
jgi:hypothetical protein